MSFVIEDETTVSLVAELAAATGVTKPEAVRRAVEAELDRFKAPSSDRPLRERFAELRARHPLPPPTGLPADKAFFDELSGP